MSKATTIKEAIRRFEERTKQNGSEAKVVELQFQWPPIEKMDSALGSLTNCEKLSLSTNSIERICGLSGLKHLKIISLGRNYIKQLTGLEAVAESLEELWISYNLIEKLKGITALRKLRVIYMSNNLVRDWSEFNKLQELYFLEDLLFVGNPIVEAIADDTIWRTECIKRLPNLKKLDGETVVNEEADNAKAKAEL